MTRKIQTLANQKQQKLPPIQIMTDSVLEVKTITQTAQAGDENGKLKRNNTDESLNTKNFIKKMTAKKEVEQKAQPKITSYMNFSNSTSYGAGDKEEQNQLMINSQDQRIKDLEERMKQRDLQIQRMKRARQIDQSRYSNLFIENRQFKKKSRDAIAKSMLEAAQYRRTERKQINPKLGYFKDGMRVFVQGSLFISLRQKIQEKQQLIKELDDQKRSKDHEKRQRAIFKIEFIQKQINLLQKQLESYQNGLNIYKERLKLSEKQNNCQFALKGWPTVFDQYQSLELLGKGGFGQVYKCYDLENNQSVAIKVNHFNEDPQHQEEFIKHVQRQAEVMKKLNHPNIGKFIKLLECSGNKVTFSLEYCSGPELSNYMKKHICLEQKQAKQIIRQIFSALNYLSSLKQKIIHYDLKPSNIMFHNGLLKLLDFGLCKSMGNEQSKIQLTSQGMGTYWYLPPQTFNEDNSQITPKVDVWSTGVIFYELLYGRKPYGHGISQDRILNQGIILNAKKVQFPVQTPRKFKVSDGAKNFIRQCFAYNPDQRLSASQAYEHEYLKR